MSGAALPIASSEAPLNQVALNFRSGAGTQMLSDWSSPADPTACCTVRRQPRAPLVSEGTHELGSIFAYRAPVLSGQWWQAVLNRTGAPRR